MTVAASRLQIGARVRSELDGKLGTVESFDAEFLPEWPWGVRWDDASYEVCSTSELAVVEAVIV